jgi:CRISPR-associated exonuclease Cas4
MSELLTMDAEEGIEIPTAAGAGRLRGLLLHKLMEEVLTGELADEGVALVSRARELLAQLVLPDTADSAVPHPDELGATISRTLALPDIAQLRHGLVPEVSVFGTVIDNEIRSLAGRADAVFMENDEPRIILDWKSDVDPTDADTSLHAAQLRAYMRAAQVIRGALVYFSSGKVHWLTMETDDT